MIEKLDTVRYIGPTVPENTDLIPGDLYQVQAVTRNQYEIINHSSAFPMRLAVWKDMVELVSKFDRSTLPEKKVVFDCTYTCDCGQEGVLILQKVADGEYYVGVCKKCEKPMNVLRTDISGLKSFRMEGDGQLVTPQIVIKTK